MYKADALTLGKAQTGTATLSGTVVDERQAVVPGATVTVEDAATRLQRQATTDAEGRFTIPLLKPSHYTLLIEHEGFTPLRIQEIILNVGDERALEIQLKVGPINGTVTITDDPANVDINPSVGTVVDRQFVENLPLNGRSFQSLLTLSPGVILTKTDFTEPGQFSVNGQRANANYFTVDGVSANIGAPGGLVPGQTGAGTQPGLSTLGGTNNLVSVDALQEFNILTSSYAAEYGRTPGAQVLMATRSGTNEFHGTLFDYFRNDALDANDWFANSRGLPKPELRQNDFGGVLGGPILLPRFGEGGRQPGYNGRNRTFFFFSYEGLRLRQTLVAITDVPSRSARSNPAASPAVLQLLNAFPQPTGPDRPNGYAEYAASFSNPSDLNATSIRIDHTLSSKLTLFGRYNLAPSDTQTRAGDGLRSLNTIFSLKTRTATFTTGATFIFNSNINNDLRFNYSRNTNSGRSTLDNFGGAQVPPDAFFFPSFASSRSDTVNVDLRGGGRNASLFIGNSANNVQRQLNLVDNLSIVSGAHLLKFGLDYRRLSPILFPRNYTQFITFNGITNASNGALTGTAQTLQIDNQKGPQVPVINNLSIYGQDTWKVSQRLTLTYGLRWEVNPPPHEANGQEAYAITAVAAPASLALAPRGAPLWKTTFNNFAPRLSLAYLLSNRPGRETVVRGGFGVFYDTGLGIVSNAYTATWPFKTTAVRTNVPFPVSASNAAPPSINANPPSTGPIYLFDPRLKLPYTYQWNFTVEQSLGSNQTLEAAYVAAAGRRLLRTEILRFGSSTNFTNPNFLSDVLLTNNAATSNYQSLQLKFQRRLSRRLQALWSYTWSHSIDIASNDSSFNNAPDALINVQSDRGASDFDVRQVLNGAVVYNLPTPPVGGFGQMLLKDWGIDSTFTARSATPVNVVIGSITPTNGFYFLRPNLIEGVPLYLRDPTLPGGQRINPAAFGRPPAGQQGNLERNALRGFPVWQVDLAIRRQFNLTERLRLQLRGEFFNLFNHPNFGDPTSGDSTWAFDLPAFNLFLLNPTFGQSSSMLGRRLGGGGNAGGFNPLYQIGGPRSVQLSLKLIF